MRKKQLSEQQGSGFGSLEELKEWLGAHPDYKEQVKMLRETLGMTQGQLGEKVDRTPRAVRQIENGEAFPRISTLQRIAEALHAQLHISIVPANDFPGKFNKEEEPGEPKEEEIEFPSKPYDDFKIGEND
jgi:transcriptional regulator with XRE-family HTH domain